jgi:GTP-binding protein HflX
MTNPYQEALGATLIERTKRERIVLVGVTLPGHTDDDTEAGLDELALLIDTAGADEAGRMVQRRDAPDHTWFIGKGKVEELKQLCLAVDADTVVFDNELAPAQQFNLEKLLGRTALDRTAVILDIFAQNAHTLEGKAQVELALLRYRLPRLRRGNKANLSQQSGGVGTRTRGTGETKLEVDRRTLTKRISRLEHDLAELRETRHLQRKSAAAAASRRSPSSATPTPARAPCSTDSPRRACWSRTGCSPRSTPPPVACRCPVASRCCSPTRSASCAGCRTG